MIVLDPGHIYQLDDGQTLKFVKRGGGAIQYPEEWPGIQTQAVMRALIFHLEIMEHTPEIQTRDSLFQLGTDEEFSLFIKDLSVVRDLVTVLEDRSAYLNAILPCFETEDAIHWLKETNEDLRYWDKNHCFPYISTEPIDTVRAALWCYEARAYRRKQESVNRKQPTHDDSVRLKPWRNLIASDVPFSHYEIERRPIGPDGHIVL